MKKLMINLIILVPLIFINAKCISPQIGLSQKFSVVGKYRVGMAYGFDVNGNYVYMGTNDGLLILDISNIKSPVFAGKLDLGFIRDVKLVDGVVYLSGGGNGFFIVDVSNVKQPKLIGKYQDNGEIYGFAKSGPYAFLCDRKEGVKVIDISDPFNPRKISHWSNGGQYWEIEIRDNLAYVADIRDGLEIIDITNPMSLTLINTVPETKGACSIQINDEQICVGTLKGIFVLDIKDPRVPSLIMSTLTSQEVKEGFISKDLLLAGTGGVIAFDITNPKDPLQLAKWTMSGTHKVIYDGSYIYTALNRFYILKLDKNQ
ncbi:MAG: hypothetical protein KKG99_13000 [Bacteroidetes bacterium]|nr:hypothetical protein [Bacteroidota bacterium]